ncbi:hypothetical protein EV127DRAFT_411712, partial [Xylaria flabelliformis]
FNGQWRDPVTGWYHLGNGYRVYNPVLKCFHSPDAWSPFISGDVNAYAYCNGDPINHIDPSGHLSIFGHEISDRDVAIIGVGIGVGIAVGILTAGAGFAVVVGASIAAGALSDVATGAAYDLASGKSPTWESVGTDALYGAVGGLLGEVAGKALEGVGRGVASGFKASARRVSKAVGRSGSFSPSAELRSSMRMRNLHAQPLGTPPEVLPVVFDNMLARPGNIGWMTHGGETGTLLGRNGFHRASVVAREDILPALQRLQEELAPGTRMEPVFTLMACHGYESGAGFAVSQVLGQECSLSDFRSGGRGLGSSSRRLTLRYPFKMRELSPRLPGQESNIMVHFSPLVSEFSGHLLLQFIALCDRTASKSSDDLKLYFGPEFRLLRSCAADRLKESLRSNSCNIHTARSRPNPGWALSYYDLFAQCIKLLESSN